MKLKFREYELNTGAKIPAIGFGTWQLAHGQETEKSVTKALMAGYRLVDTAKIYGNEESVGQAIANSGVPREDIFVTTKLWNSDQGYESALQAFNASLQKLGLEYVDLYLIHFPGRHSRRRADSWRALQKLQKDGLAKAIGVSNYSIEHLEELQQVSSVVPAVNQVEFHPFIYNGQRQLVNYCAKRGILIESYSPLARGKLSNPTLGEIGSKYNKSSSQVMLRWALQQGAVPLPRSSNPKHQEDNLAVFDFKLSPTDMKTINELGGSKSSLPFLARFLK